MAKEWIKGQEGRNLKFKRETLLNLAINRWALNKAFSIGPTSELIRRCSPRKFDEWEQFYFENAYQKKKDGIKITREYIQELGRKLYIKVSEVVQNEIESIQEEECVDYAYNLVLNRTYEGYKTEITTIYGQLEKILAVKIEPAPDEWDRTYSVDFFIKVNGKYVGLQIKPISSSTSPNSYRWYTQNEANHKKFQHDFGGKVFFVYSAKSGVQKQIYNTEVIEEIRSEINRLESS